MLRRILFAAVIAGAAAGLVATILQAAKLTPLILVAETYEHAAPAGHHHNDAGVPHDHAAQADEDSDHAWHPENGRERLAYTLVFNLLTGVGFALLVNAGLALREAAGAAPDISRGLFWGLAGFASFALAPSLGLPPELPGMPAADLLDRQIWWIATAIATAAGIGLLAHAASATTQRGVKAALGLALIAAPHLVGAPQPGLDEASEVPARLAAEFTAASLASAAAFWVVLGALSGWLQRRLA